MTKEIEKSTVKNYLPDILIILGIYFLSKSIFTENMYPHAVHVRDHHFITDWGAVWGIVMVTIGIIVVIRKHLIPKNSSKKTKKRDKS